MKFKPKLLFRRTAALITAVAVSTTVLPSISFAASATTNYKASTDSAATSKGTLLHVTAVAADKTINHNSAECPDNCNPGKNNQMASKNSERVYKPGGTPMFRVEPTTVINFNDAATGTGTREIHVKIVNLQKTPPVGQAAKDRIKTYDVTQLIEATQQTVNTGSVHLTEPASKSVDKDPDQYNTSKNPIYKGHNDHVSDSTGIGIITSFNKPEVTNNAVHANNYLSGTKNPCSASCSANNMGSHSGGCYSTDSDGHKHLNCSSHHHSSCGWKCGYNESDCHWLEESVVVVFGKTNPPEKQKSEKTTDGKGVKTKTSWKEPTSSSSPVAWGEVGFAIGETYYNKNAVVKLHVAGQPTSKVNESGKSYYLLPKLDASKAMPTQHGVKANEFATFDVLLGASGNTENYWLRYVDSGDTGVIGTSGFVQYSKFEDNDKSKDWKNSQGAGKWDYLNGNQGAKIDGAKFISHRDLLSGDNIASSLVVSGYMAKYGYKAETADYLKFMEKAGFTFRGLNNVHSISGKADAYKLTYASGEDNTAKHATRVLDIANELTLTDIKATFTGNTSESYNTVYQGGSKGQLADQYKVRFGLGGVSGDGGEIFNRFINDTNLGDISINTTSSEGDASRSTWYYATYARGTTASCWNLVNVGHAGHGGSGCCSTHTTHTATDETHSGPHAAALASCLSSNNYIAKNADIFINNMKKSKTHSSLDISGGSQTGAIEQIITSRLSFKINLGVEGTIAGVWNSENINGLDYNKDKLVVEGGVLKYQETPATGADVEKTWRENTFEMVQTHYANVGSGNKTDNQRGTKNTEVLAEYRYSIPTKAFKFNPSYYMQFDKGFNTAEQNQSVWMLSNQPREINFKDILDVRLTQAVEKKQNTHATDITEACANGYATVINSEWSTDKNDLTVQHTTGIPTLKAGNAYTTSSEEQGGSITMYVVLQDPEFVSESSRAAVEAYNNSVMQSYQQSVKDILAEMNVMSANTHAYTARTATSTNDKFGLAMYTNMENGSSVNSAMQIHTGIEELKDKEPMVINSNGDEVFSYKSRMGVLAETNTPASINYNNWAYFALKGNTFQAKLNGDEFGEGTGFNSKTDISETATIAGGTSSKRTITINGTSNTVYSMASKDIPYYVTDTLKMYNDRLTGIMSAPQYSVDNGRKTKGSTTVPASYDPYLAADITSAAYEFDWYGEDYEGFVVAVYNIEFSRYTKDAYKSISGKWGANTSNGKTTTDQSSVYRHESDWRSNTNSDADLSKYDKTEGASMHYLETPAYKIAGVEGLYASKNEKINNLEFSKDGTGKVMLITTTGQETLKNWSEGKKADGTSMDADAAKVFKDTYADGIYGVGVELANMPIYMHNPATGATIGTTGTNCTRVSFFYQPTYFNIRGSVFDTAR